MNETGALLHEVSRTFRDLHQSIAFPTLAFLHVTDRLVDLAHNSVRLRNRFRAQAPLFIGILLELAGGAREVASYAEFFRTDFEFGPLDQLKRGVTAGSVGGKWPLRLLLSGCQVCLDGVLVQEVRVVLVRSAVVSKVVVRVVAAARGVRIAVRAPARVVVVAVLAVLAKPAVALFPEPADPFIVRRRAL